MNKKYYAGIKTAVIILFIGLFSINLFAAGESEARGRDEFSETDPIRVFVSITPQAYFVERIGGARVKAEVLVEPGRDPHTFDPRPQQISRLSQADIYFTVGIPFEQVLIPKIAKTNRTLRVVDTLDGLDLFMGVPHYHYDEEGNPYLHGADDPDLHVWLGPAEVRKQIRTIRDALIELDPRGEVLYNEAYRKFDSEIAEMDKRFAQVLAPYKGKSILVFHPAFAYFTRTYGINQRAIELEGKEPSPRQLERLIDQALREGTEVVFTQPEFPLRSAEIIARAIGGRVVILNPLDPDWPKLMEQIASSIAEGTF